VKEISEIMPVLVKKRSIFHSEADFQHALAWEIHQELANASVRLELPIQVKNQYLHIDIWVEQQGEPMALELKYKTRSLSVRIGNEQFSLKDQSAQDIGKYDFLKDVQRLEQIVAEKRNCIGYAVLLTNDSAYWTRTANQNTNDADFRIYDGRILEGQLQWGANASEGTKRNREQPITLRNRYVVKWEDYSQPSTVKYGAFRFCIIRVSKEQEAQTVRRWR
jgi:hypothetical protein